MATPSVEPGGKALRFASAMQQQKELELSQMIPLNATPKGTNVRVVHEGKSGGALDILRTALDCALATLDDLDSAAEISCAQAFYASGDDSCLLSSSSPCGNVAPGICSTPSSGTEIAWKANGEDEDACLLSEYWSSLLIGPAETKVASAGLLSYSHRRKSEAKGSLLRTD